jgi:hypothetical protein
MCMASYRKSTNTAQGDILPDTSYHISGNTTWHQEGSKIHGNCNRDAHKNVGYFMCWKPRKLHIEKNLKFNFGRSWINFML